MTKPRRVAILVFPDFQLLDATGPASVFEVANGFAPGAYDVSLVAAEPGPVRSSSGVVVHADALPTEALHTLVVAGGSGSRQARYEAPVQNLVRQTTGRIASVCSGAFVLAEAGLLDGGAATTHWRLAAQFARAYPKVRVEPDRIFVREGRVWTSAGITAGIDLALALVGQDLGEVVAKDAARELVVFHRRPGGQSQYSALLELEGRDPRFAALIGWMRERLHEPLGVERLAERAGMSPRTFARQFATEAGKTPARAVMELRVEAARARVEQGGEPIEAIARESGFGDPERMRRAFIRSFGQPPQGLRRSAKR
jgi:transcriptional regulator GlxA family with amidase domain